MRLVAGVDLGGMKIQAAVVEPDGGDVRGHARRATPRDHGPDGVAAAIAESVEEAAAGAGVAASDLTAVGVGSPGTVDADAGTVASAHNVVPGWSDPYPLAARLGDRLGTGVRLANDVEAATEAELRLGAGRGHDALLCVFWGTGVGSGVVLDGRLWLGRGAAGELGHMVVHVGGRVCPCGRRGCVEAYAGRGAMEAEARAAADAGEPTVLFEVMEERGKGRLASGVWERALKRGDRLAHRLVDEAVGALAAGIGSAVNLLDVGAVVVGGGLGDRLAPTVLDGLRARTMRHLFVPERPPEFLAAALGDLGGARGAALLAEARVGGRV